MPYRNDRVQYVEEQWGQSIRFLRATKARFLSEPGLFASAFAMLYFHNVSNRDCTVFPARHRITI
jgi:hypothetical protein